MEIGLMIGFFPVFLFIKISKHLKLFHLLRGQDSSLLFIQKKI